MKEILEKRYAQPIQGTFFLKRDDLLPIAFISNSLQDNFNPDDTLFKEYSDEEKIYGITMVECSESEFTKWMNS